MLDDEGMFRPSGGGIFSQLLNNLNVFQPISTWLNNIRFQGIFRGFLCKDDSNDQHNGDKKEITIYFPFFSFWTWHKTLFVISHRNSLSIYQWYQHFFHNERWITWQKCQIRIWINLLSTYFKHLLKRRFLCEGVCVNPVTDIKLWQNFSTMHVFCHFKTNRSMPKHSM